MDIRQLKTFLAIAHHGTFSRAATAVHLTQSAVSQQISELERELQLALFDRNKRPTTLTFDGRRLVKTAHKILLTHQEFLNSCINNQAKGGIVLGAVRSTSIGGLPQALIDLRNNHPGLSIKLVNRSRLSADLVEDVSTGRIDAGLIVNTSDLPKDLIWRPYTTERYYVIGKDNIPGDTDVELLNSAPYLHYVPTLPTEKRIDKELTKRNIQLNPEMELDTFDSILLMVSHGLGVGIVPEPYLNDSNARKIRCIPFGNPPLHRELGIISRPECSKAHLIDILWSKLREQTIMQ